MEYLCQTGFEKRKKVEKEEREERCQPVLKKTLKNEDKNKIKSNQI